MRLKALFLERQLDCPAHPAPWRTHRAAIINSSHLPDASEELAASADLTVTVCGQQLPLHSQVLASLRLQAGQVPPAAPRAAQAPRRRMLFSSHSPLSVMAGSQVCDVHIAAAVTGDWPLWLQLADACSMPRLVPKAAYEVVREVGSAGRVDRACLLSGLQGLSAPTYAMMLDAMAAWRVKGGTPADLSRWAKLGDAFK